MPLFRFVFFASGFIVCGFLAANAFIADGKVNQSSAEALQSSLHDWRHAEARKSGPVTASAIILPSIAETGPTPERLAFERQLASNTVPAPVYAQAEPDRAANARAEMAEAAPQRSAPQNMASKPKRKALPRPEILAADRGPAPREFGGFFGGVFSN